MAWRLRITPCTKLWRLHTAGLTGSRPASMCSRVFSQMMAGLGGRSHSSTVDGSGVVALAGWTERGAGNWVSAAEVCGGQREDELRPIIDKQLGRWYFSL